MHEAQNNFFMLYIFTKSFNIYLPIRITSLQYEQMKKKACRLGNVQLKLGRNACTPHCKAVLERTPQVAHDYIRTPLYPIGAEIVQQGAYIDVYFSHVTSPKETKAAVRMMTVSAVQPTQMEHGADFISGREQVCQV